MDEDAKKTALRMIPYGMYVLTTKSNDGKDVGTATVNWLTQTSFAPPLIAVGIKADSGTHQHIKDTGVFAVNVIGTDQKDMAFTFFKPLERDGNSIGGQEFEDSAETKSPL
ncbi:MAG: flavin reductase family protein, partial [SAR202 cluster bacterium]|nr:flavin reductase family protein [SAR202 cluster bacterium]